MKESKYTTITVSRSLVGVVMFIGAVLAAYYTSQLAFADRVASVEKDTAVNAANIENVTGALEKIDKKLDIILQQRNGAITQKIQ